MNTIYWPKLTQIWPKFGHIWLYQVRSTGVQKFWKKIIFFNFFFFFKIEKNIFWVKKINFFLLWPPLRRLSLPTPRKILKFIKWRFFAFFSRKKLKFLFFFHFFSWNMVSIVEVEIFGFLPFSNWPDFDQKKMVKNRSFWASNGSK